MKDVATLSQADIWQDIVKRPQFLNSLQSTCEIGSELSGHMCRTAAVEGATAHVLEDEAAVLAVERDGEELVDVPMAVP